VSASSLPLQGAAEPGSGAAKTLTAFASRQELVDRSSAGREARRRAIAEAAGNASNGMVAQENGSCAYGSAPVAALAVQGREGPKRISVTNVQHAGVDEGAIAQSSWPSSGPFLRRRRLFTVRIGTIQLKRLP